jgi:KDO2-lipid IV(A) lauroyltransferase
MALFRVLGLDRLAPGRLDRPQYLSAAAARPDRARQSRSRLPEKADDERNDIRRLMWDNLGRVVGEYPHLGRFSPKGEDPRIAYSFPPGMTLESLTGKPLLFLSGHFANWEMMPILAHQLGSTSPPWCARPTIPMSPNGWRASAASMARTPDRQAQCARADAGPAARDKSLCMLVDQKLREGIAVPFFGRDAMTTPAPAALALKTGAQSVIAANRRLPGARFHVTVHRRVGLHPSGDDTEDIRRSPPPSPPASKRSSAPIPGKWLWIHNRWPTSAICELMTGRA